MAVTTTVGDIIVAALAKSTKNRANAIATSATELTGAVYRAICGAFSLAASVDPTFFGKSASVALSGGAWPFPEDAESIFRIENLSGEEVALVPQDDKGAERVRPAVFRVGRSFYGAGNSGDPTTGNLVFWYSKRPSALTATTDVLDSMWLEAYNELLVLDLAIYLAVKDGRDDEAQLLGAERSKWADLFSAHIVHATVNEVRRFGNVGQFNANTRTPLGGAS